MSKKVNFDGGDVVEAKIFNYNLYIKYASDKISTTPHQLEKTDFSTVSMRERLIILNSVENNTGFDIKERKKARKSALALAELLLTQSMNDKDAVNIKYSINFLCNDFIDNYIEKVNDTNIYLVLKRFNSLFSLHMFDNSSILPKSICGELLFILEKYKSMISDYYRSLYDMTYSKVMSIIQPVN